MTELIEITKLDPNIGQIEGLPQNPRFIRDSRFEKLKKSLRDDPEMLHLRELIVYPFRGRYVVIGGNMRLRAAKELGFTDMPCKVLDANTPAEKLRAYTIKDNVAFGENDDSLLDEWDEIELEDFGLDFGVETDFLMPTRAPRDTPEIAETTARKDSANAAATKAVLADTEEEVIKKIGLADPQYTPTDRIWETGDLFVEKSPLSPEEIQQIEDPNIRRLVEIRCAFFTDFKFDRIADYFVNQATPTEKDIFKRLGLVLLDYGDMIKYGFKKVVKTSVEEVEEDADLVEADEE